MNLFTKIFFIIFLSFSILISCDNQKAGTFAVKFSWASDGEGKEIKPDVSTGEFFVTVRIYEWKEGVAFPGDIAANGKQLIQSDPAQMKVKGTIIDFGDLSYGKRRFVVAEIRKGEELTGGILFTGMSQLFDFEAGKHTEVNVNMSMTPTPGVDEDGKRIDAELRIVDDNGNLRSYTSGTDLKVKLRLLNAVSFTHVYFANKEENIKTANGKSYKIGELKKIKGVENGYELDGEWDLSFGLTADEIAVLPELKVYARLENEYGTGLLVMAKIALDNQSPELTLGLNPAYTNGSKTITLNISSNELIKHDTLNIKTSNPKLLFDCPAPTKNESLSFTCEIETLDAVLKDGDYTITVSATDQAGNVSEEGKTTLTIDRESPELTFVAYKNGTEVNDTIYLKENDEFKVDLTLSKEPAEIPVVRLGSAGINCEKTADLKYSCVAEIKEETHTEGISDLSVTYHDMAENQFSKIIVSGIRLDYTEPVLKTQIVPGNKSLNASQILQITVNASEELNSNPTVTLTKNGGGTITPSNTEVQGLSYIYTYPILADGTYSFTANATDLAGHNAPQVSITSIISDSSVPTVSGVVTVNPDRIKPSATSTITFTASETMNDTGDTVEVKVGNGTANCTTSNGLNYSCTYTGTAGTEDSIETVIIKLTDASANTSTGSQGTVYVDRTAPAITIDLNKNAFNSSDIIRVSVTSSEELVSAPAVEIPEISMSLSNVTQISNFSWIFTVDPADLIDDDYTVTAEGVDLVSLTGSDVAYFSVDSSIPDLVTGTIDRTKAGLNITYTVDFEITEPVTGGIPVVKANDIALTNCVQNGSDKIFKCSRTVGAEETDSTVYAVIATLTDEAGNSRTVSIGTLLIDKIPPNVVPGSAYLSIDAGADCELAQNQIKSLGNGSSAHISLQLTEKLETGFAPVLVARKSGAADRVFTLDAQSGLTLYFSHSYNEINPPEEYSGEYALYLSLKDEAGNVAEPMINPDKSFKIAQIKEPKLVINQDLVSYTRSPWGRSKEYELKDEGGITQYTVPANEYYELGPNNVYEATDRLPADTFTLNYGTVSGTPARLKIRDKDGTEVQMAHNTPNADGSWPRTRIWSYDSSEIFVSAIDNACRETGTIKIQNINWIATMNKKVVGSNYENPHKFLITGIFLPTFEQDASLLQEPQIYNPSVGQLSISTLGAPPRGWEIKNPSVAPPVDSIVNAMAYDSARNETIILVEETELLKSDETWAWNGSLWNHLTPTNQPDLNDMSIAYDTVRSKTVLFGAYNPLGSEPTRMETWEWDGNNWTRLIPTNTPSVMYKHAMAYDRDNGKVVQFGGEYTVIGTYYRDDTWEWDGVNWEQKNPATKPSARSGHAMAYDSVRGKVILFGGKNDAGYNNETWEWDGTNWTKFNPVDKPPKGIRGMVYDSDRGKVLLGQGTMFEWDGSNWITQYSATNPSNLSGEIAMTYDIERGKAVLFGGTTWEWSGGGRDKPAHIVQVNYEKAGISDESKTIFNSLSILFNTGGNGDVTGVFTSGVSLAVWKNDAWQIVSSNTAGLSNPTSVRWIANDDSVIRSVIDSDNGYLNFAVMPTAPRGFAASPAEILSDYTELVLQYTLFATDEHTPVGHLDVASFAGIGGWSCDKDDPSENINVQLSFYSGTTFLTTIDIGPTNVASEQAVQDICGPGSTTHRFAWSPNTSLEIQQALDNHSISSPAMLTVHVYGMNTGPVPPGSNAELWNSPKMFVYCTNNCDPYLCGDGLVNSGLEICDDGNDVNEDNCKNDCSWNVCGDGYVYEGVEECDDGNFNTADSCVVCKNAFCGDGYQNIGVETCDDGNNNDNDYCSGNCMSVTFPDKVIVSYLGDIDYDGWVPTTSVCPGIVDVSGRKCSPSNYAETSTNYTINAKKAYVFFDSDAGQGYNGFEIIRNGEVLLKYPLTGTYQDETEQLWVLDANNAIGNITLKILANGIEYQSSCAYDFVKIDACVSFSHGSVPSACTLEARYQGTTIPVAQTYPTNHLMTRFISDAGITYDGFKLTANGVSYQTTPFNNYTNNMDQYLDIVTATSPTTVVFQNFQTENGSYGSDNYACDYMYLYSCPNFD